MGTLGPIFTIILVIYLLDEPITVCMIVEMLIVMCGVRVLMINKQ